MRKNGYNVSVFLRMRALRTFVDLLIVADDGTQHTILHSEFCAVWLSLSKVASKRIWLINIITCHLSTLVLIL